MTMMILDLIAIVCWWVTIFIIGLLFLPVTFKLFKKFWDKGWVFSKIIGVISVSYVLFVLGKFDLVPFLRESIIFILFLVLIFDIWYLSDKKRKRIFLGIIKANKKVFLLEEITFLVTLSFWTFIRGFQPHIEGLEKFMDFGFVNSILRTFHFPPSDMWFAGESINYYYFGHLQVAMLTKLSGLSSVLTYNLSIATLFALTFTGSFSLASNLIYLVKKGTKTREFIVGGLISALLLTLGGNLHTAVYTLKDGVNGYWYPDATRFIGYQPDNPNDKTIHEFPSYSFVVSDLHGHVNDIPAVLLFVSLLVVLGLKKKSILKDFPILGFLLAVMYMTNSWDLPIYGLLFAIFSFLRFWVKGKSLVDAIFKTIPQGIVVLLFAIIFALPFAASFSPMTEGIEFVNAHSLWWQLLVLWGFFWFNAVIFWVFYGLLKRKKKTSVDTFVFSGTFLATLLIIIPEIVYVKDIYISEYHRANTMFKLVYQSFIFYSLASGFILWRIKGVLKKKSKIIKISFCLIFLLGFSAHLIYPYFAIKGYYDGLKNYQGLSEGMGFLEENYSGVLEAINWLNQNVDGQPNILEATGESYTFYNVVSSATGLPTIEGWLVHEWLWRGGYGQPSERSTEVEQIYQGEDDDLAAVLLRKYNIEYVLLSSLEREKYPEIKEERFSSLGEKVFTSGETDIYHLDRL